jgi:outer membrane autotransporter protein
MGNMSKQAESIRVLARGENKSVKPQGPAGPSTTTNMSGLQKGDWTLFARQFNDLGGIDSDGTIAGYDWQTHGFLVGSETLASEHVLFAVAGGGTWTDLDGNSNSGDGSSDMLNIAAYGDYFTENWYTELGASCGYAKNKSLRIDTAGSRYNGKYDSTMLGIWFEGGHTFAMNDSFGLEPYGRMSYIRGEHDGYTETGGSGAMTVSDHSTDNFITEFGLRTNKDWSVGTKGKVRMTALVGWRQEWLDDIITVNTSVMGISQQARSPSADSGALVLGLNADWYINESWSVGLQYAPTFSGNWQNHAINGSLIFKF